MYAALLILIAGIACGRLFAAHLSGKVVSALTMAAIFLLLFLLGAAIGSNGELLARLPNLGFTALIIALCCLAGSIAAAMLITPVLKHLGENKKNAR